MSDEPFVANVRDLPWVHSDTFRSAGVEVETASAKEAYAPFGHWKPSEPLDLRDLM